MSGWSVPSFDTETCDIVSRIWTASRGRPSSLIGCGEAISVGEANRHGWHRGLSRIGGRFTSTAGLLQSFGRRPGKLQQDCGGWCVFWDDFIAGPSFCSCCLRVVVVQLDGFASQAGGPVGLGDVVAADERIGVVGS